MKILRNKKGQVFVWEVILAAAIIGYGTYQTHEGKWGKNGSESIPTLGPVETRSELTGSLLKV